MSREQKAGQNYNIKTGYKSIEKVQYFIYFGTTLTNQNCIYEEIKNGLKWGILAVMRVCRFGIQQYEV